MKCKNCLKGKTFVESTRCKDNKIIRYRKCPICNKKMQTIELDIVRYRNEVFVKKQIKDLIKSIS